MERIKDIATIYMAIKDMDGVQRQDVFNKIKQLGEVSQKSSPMIYSVLTLDDMPYPAREDDICYVTEVNLPGTYHNGEWIFNVPRGDYDTMWKFKNRDMQFAAPPPNASPADPDKN